MKIILFIPCFVDQLFPSVGISAVRIFEKLGHTVDFKEAIFCCGQPLFNGGYWEETRGIATRVLVFWASNGQEACDYVVALAKEKEARLIIKSKSMTSEEIHLSEALKQAGYEVVESDLGEYIVQLREEAPYHLVFPAMHLTRHEISDLFHEKLHSQPTDSPEELTMIARRPISRCSCRC